MISFFFQQKNSKKNKVDLIIMKDEKLLLEKLSLKDKMILLDERRIQFDSEGFANKLQYFKCQGFKHFLFIINGLYGFSTILKNQFAEHSVLSQMTFSHQMIRLFL